MPVCHVITASLGAIITLSAFTLSTSKTFALTASPPSGSAYTKSFTLPALTTSDTNFIMIKPSWMGSSGAPIFVSFRWVNETTRTLLQAVANLSVMLIVVSGCIHHRNLSLVL